MRILALEPFYGGSHRALLDGWVRRSRHELVRLTLSAHHWKWRVRHAPIALAERVQGRACPELFPKSAPYDGTVSGLVDRLVELAQVKAATGGLDSSFVGSAAPFCWDRAAARMDRAIEDV